MTKYSFRRNIRRLVFFLFPIFIFAVQLGACSHNEAIFYFAQSILVKNSFKAIQCKSWNNFRKNKCHESSPTTHMGEYVDKKYVFFNPYIIVNDFRNESFFIVFKGIEEYIICTPKRPVSKHVF